jgi:hypothetical protein
LGTSEVVLYTEHFRITGCNAPKELGDHETMVIKVWAESRKLSNAHGQLFIDESPGYAIRRSLRIHNKTNTPQPHPETGEYSSPPLGGGQRRLFMKSKAKANYADTLHPPSDRAEDTSGDGCGSTVNVVYLSQDFIGN